MKRDIGSFFLHAGTIALFAVGCHVAELPKRPANARAHTPATAAPMTPDAEDARVVAEPQSMPEPAPPSWPAKRAKKLRSRGHLATR